MNKGFTLVELLATFAIIGIVASIAVFTYSGIVNNTHLKAYKNYEKTMEESSVMYIIKHGIPKENYITLKELIDDNRLDLFVNPKSDDHCLNSYVIIKKDSLDKTNITYKACLICDNYKTKDCKLIP